MAITTLDGFIASAKQRIPICKTAGRTTVANGWFSMFDLAGLPGAGTLAGSSTSAGVVPDDTVAGYPSINAFGGGATGYLARFEYGNTVSGRIDIFDRVWVGGADAFNATQTLSAQPSYSARMPGGSDYTGTEIWIEAVTAFTGNLSVAVTYTNQSGTTGHTTGTFATGNALTVGRCMQLPFQAGDCGVQKIETVTGTVATVGTFNVMVLRRLGSARVKIANDGDVQDMLRCGLPQVFATSALYALVCPDSTAIGVPDLNLLIANA